MERGMCPGREGTSRQLAAYEGTLERPIRSSMKLLMRLEGPLSFCDSEWSFQTRFLTLFTHKSYHHRIGSQELFPKQSVPLEAGMSICPSTPGKEDRITAIRVRGVLRDDEFIPVLGH